MICLFTRIIISHVDTTLSGDFSLSHGHTVSQNIPSICRIWRLCIASGKRLGVRCRLDRYGNMGYFDAVCEFEAIEEQDIVLHIQNAHNNHCGQMPIDVPIRHWKYVGSITNHFTRFIIDDMQIIFIILARYYPLQWPPISYHLGWWMCSVLSTKW